ncbi:MAG: hypothetical protein ACO1N2_02950 [Candidatus Saccharimonadota bacterium]
MEDKDMAVSLQITGDGMSVNREITLTQAGKIVAFIGSEVEGEAPLQSLHLGAGVIDEPAANTQQSRQSLREKLEAANAKTHAQRITVLGYHLSSLSQEGEFTISELKQLYPQAREKMPPNFSRELDLAITSGYLEGVHGKKDTYYVTNTGEDSIVAGFSGGMRKSSSKPKAKAANVKPKAVSAESVSEAVRELHPVTPDLAGYQNYHAVSTKGLKVLWILAYAQANNIDKLSPREITFIASKLRDKIDARDVNGLTVTAAKNGWIAKDNEANYSLLFTGDEHLKSLVTGDGAN